MSIYVKMDELNAFADTMQEHLGRQTSLDEFIPLPGVSKKEQIKRIDDCEDHRDERYWEIDDYRGHGWCCGHCGKVVQWG